MILSRPAEAQKHTELVELSVTVDQNQTVTLWRSMHAHPSQKIELHPLQCSSSSSCRRRADNCHRDQGCPHSYQVSPQQAQNTERERDRTGPGQQGGAGADRTLTDCDCSSNASSPPSFFPSACSSLSRPVILSITGGDTVSSEPLNKTHFYFYNCSQSLKHISLFYLFSKSNCLYCFVFII